MVDLKVAQALLPVPKVMYWSDKHLKSAVIPSEARNLALAFLQWPT
jgi:hypothetical protein